MDKRKMANNILEFLYDPTIIPIEKRLYFRKEENLKNESFEKAKAESHKNYKDQRLNSDFYPRKQPNEREALSMDRKTLIASFDILSQTFDESDPISTNLQAMAQAVAKMSDEELETRVKVEAKAKTFKCPKCGTNVLEKTGYCVKCKAKVKPKAASDNTDSWTKEASELVKKNLIADVVGEEALEKIAGKKKGPGVPDGTGPLSETPLCPIKEKESAEEVIPEMVVPPPPPPEPDKGKITIVIDKCAQEVPEEKKEEPKKEEIKPACDVSTPEKAPKEKKEEEPKKAEEVKPAKVVDTSILNIDGIEMSAGMILPEELEPMSPEEEMKLSQLFK